MKVAILWLLFATAFLPIPNAILKLETNTVSSNSTCPEPQSCLRSSNWLHSVKYLLPDARQYREFLSSNVSTHGTALSSWNDIKHNVPLLKSNAPVREFWQLDRWLHCIEDEIYFRNIWRKSVESLNIWKCNGQHKRLACILQEM